MVTLTQTTADEAAQGSPDAPVASLSYVKTLEKVLSREKVIKSEWLDKTKDIYPIYDGSKSEETPFNILYSNTEILVPNLFSSAPKPIVRRRFGELRADAAASAAERMAEYSMDTNLSGYPDFVDAVESVVLDAALPGQGQTRVRLVGETACIDYVQHDAFIWGYAKRWEDTPWVAYRHDKTVEDAIREFEVDAAQAALMIKPSGDSDENKDKGPQTIPVYEVWNKADRTVLFLTEALPDRLLKKMDDPLELNGFFPSERPLRLLSTPLSTMPKSLYGLYRKQAEELNQVTGRIKRITQAIKVRGIFDGALPEMQQVFSSGDTENALIPAADPGVLMREGGIDKRIWLVPIDKYVEVLRQLYTVRDQIKSTIYEILGIGDILRGVSAASETASAQQIKDKWGSLRIKRSRERVSAFVRAQIRLIVEVSAKHTPEEVWAQVTGLPYTSSANPPPPPMPGQDPAPVWSQVLEQLRNDLTRSYVIDIEANSTVDGDATEEKAEATEFMTAFSQAMQGLGSLAAVGPEGFEAAKFILMEVCKRFRMGNDLAAIVMKMTPPPKGPTPEQEQAQKDIEQKTQKADQAQESADAAMSAVKDQFTQQKDQIGQLADSVQNQQRTLDQTQLALDRKDMELQSREKDMALREQALKLSQREAECTVAETVQSVTVDHAKKTLDFQKQVLDQRETDTQAGEEKLEEQQGATALDAVLKAVEEQTKLFEAILAKMSKPVKVIKTGPDTYERIAQ